MDGTTVAGFELPGVVAQPAENTANAAANTATTVLTARIPVLVFLALIDRAFRLLVHTVIGDFRRLQMLSPSLGMASRF